MEAQLISLLHRRPLVTVREAVCLLDATESDVQAVFAAVVSSNAGSYALLRDATTDEEREGEAARGGRTMRSTPPKAAEADTNAYALLALTYPNHAAVAATPVALRPAVGDALRNYPVVSRAALESRPADAAGPVPVALPLAPAAATAAPIAKCPSPVKKIELAAVKVEAAAPAAVEAAPCPLPPVLTAVEVEAPVRCALPVLPAPETVAVPAPAALAVPAVVAQPSATAPTTPSPRQPTIFDKMKEAAATKRQRDGDEAPAKAKKASPAAKPKKAAKTENTTSLAKLARASKKKNAGAAPTCAPVAANFLDEDDGDAMNGFSNSEESTQNEAPIVQEETPVLDVVEVSASNDEVILCDDAPPLAFCPAPPLAPAAAAAATKREATGKKAAGAAGAAAAGVTGAAQSTLGSFFNSAVVDFQRSYVRDVQTEMKVEDGEYICVDVPCYRHKATGEVISEEDYHQRTAQLLRSNESSSESPVKKAAGAGVESPPSPAAKSASRSPNEKAEKAKATPAPTQTLLSFFKPAV